MTSLSKPEQRELNIRQNLALQVYLGVYRELIELVKPSMGLVEVDKALVLDVFRVMSEGDMVVDITDAVDLSIARPSLRSYISDAGYLDIVKVTKLVLDIVKDPSALPYFAGFRTAVVTRMVNTLRKKKWGMDNIQHIPYVTIGELGETQVNASYKITLRLRN